MSTQTKQKKKVTIDALLTMKAEGMPISMLTAYDYPTALLIDQSEVEMILVGDSLGMVVHGLPNTLGVTMDMMVLHCQAVARGASAAYLVGDMPFMSYQASVEDAVRNAGRLVAEGSMDAVKLEGGREFVGVVEAIQRAGMAVQGHIGLTPQSISKLGGFKAQGKTAAAAHKLLDDALALQEAGCFSIVLEAVPDKLAEYVSQRLDIPTIGIGAGAGCDGQVLVTHDLLGLFDRFTPKFVKKYSNQADAMREAFSLYRDEVRARTFPTEAHTYPISEEEWSAFSANGSAS